MFWQRIFFVTLSQPFVTLIVTMHPAEAEARGDQLRLWSVTFPDVSRVQSSAIIIT